MDDELERLRDLLETISNRSELPSPAEDALFSLYSRPRSSPCIRYVQAIYIFATPLPQYSRKRKYDNTSPPFRYLDNLARSLSYVAAPKGSLS